MTPKYKLCWENMIVLPLEGGFGAGGPRAPCELRCSTRPITTRLGIASRTERWPVQSQPRRGMLRPVHLELLFFADLTEAEGNLFLVSLDLACLGCQGPFAPH